jgi:hypothetical protein
MKFMMGSKRKAADISTSLGLNCLVPSRRDQVDFILRLGSKTDFPCDFCLSHREGCIMPPSASSLSKCAACTRRGKPCTRCFHPGSDYQSILAEDTRLSLEIQSLDSLVEAGHSRIKELNDSLHSVRSDLEGFHAKRRRLVSQQALIRERGLRIYLDDRRLEVCQTGDHPSSPPCSPSSLVPQTVATASDAQPSLVVDLSGVLDLGLPPISSDPVLVPDDLLFALLEDSHIPESSQGS